MKHIIFLAKSACLLLFFSFQTTFASHMMGGDISYVWLGAKKYQFTFTVYRDCRGIPFNSPSIKLFDGASTSRTVSYIRTAINDMTLLCSDTLKSPCSPVNTAAQEGIEEHVFKAIVDFADTQYSYFVNNKICKVYVQMEQCCRNGAITTISPGNFYVEAMLDICNSKFENSSPQFINVGSLTAYCNRPFKTNVGGIDLLDFDSISYELFRPMNGYNSYESYTGSFTSSIPMTPYCPPNPGVLTCKAFPNQKPPRGFYFDPKTADIVFTPTKCDEVGVISLKTIEWRKVNGNWISLGYIVRDIQIIVKQGADNNPPELSFSDKYQFKTREKTCFDVVSSDVLYLPNQKDTAGITTSIKVMNPPPGSTFKYKDSSAIQKTGEFCWDVHDSAYLQLRNISKSIQVTFETKDYFCPKPSWARRTALIQLLPPDSSGFVSISTYFDANKSLSKDSLEKALPLKLLVKRNSNTFGLETDKNGRFEDLFGIGTYKFGLTAHPYFESLIKDSTLTVQMDSSHQIDFPVYKKPGIFGRVYKDNNKNCVFDSGDVALKGILVHTDSSRILGLSDQNGMYYLPVKTSGNYVLTCEFKPNAYQINCPVSQTISLSYQKDSVVEDHDFGISENPNFTDIQVAIKTGRLFRRGQSSTATVQFKNQGHQAMYNIDILVPVPKNLSFTKGSTTHGVGGDTIKIHIDTLDINESGSMEYTFFINSNLFKVNDRICFYVFTDSITTKNDSVKRNNRFNICNLINAPYDPNEKTVNTESAITTLDQTIDYTVYFQNTGTDTAFRVMVTDTINTQYLNLKDFELNWSDAPCEVLVAGNVLYFIFDPIHLPHFGSSGDKSISGFSFRLGLKSNVAKEEVFSNQVGIYFDFEDAVLTKLCQTNILSPTHITGYKNKTFCSNGINTLYLKSNIKLNADNEFIIEMSDALDNFKNPVQVASILSDKIQDSIKFNFNSSINGEKLLRIRTTSPASVGIPDNGVITVDANSKKHFLLNTNINNYTLCENDSLYLGIVGTYYDYKISRNGIDLSPFNQVKSYSFKLNKNDQFIIYAKDPANQCADSSHLRLNILEAPQLSVSITENKQAYCLNDQINIEVNGAKNYSISDGSKTILPLGTANQVKYTLVQSAKIWAYGIDDNSCFNHSDTSFLTVYQATKPVIQANKNDLSINLYPGIKWYFNNQLSGVTDPVYPDAASGSYYVEVADSNACENQSDVYNHNRVTLSELDKQSRPYRIYPNPTNGLIHFSNLSGLTYTLTIYNSLGLKVMEYKQMDGDFKIDMSELSGACYMIEMIDSNGEYSYQSLQLLR